MPAIENVDDLREWLVKKLEPICDADPVPLAKYCIALAKKDKPEDELKTFCNDQLEVFLQSETPKFVDDLFDCLRTKSYIPKEKHDNDALPAYPPLPPEAAPSVPPPAPPPDLPQEEPPQPPPIASESATKFQGIEVPSSRRDGPHNKEKEAWTPPRTRSSRSRSFSPRRRRREEDRLRNRRDDRERDRFDRDRRSHRGYRNRSNPNDRGHDRGYGRNRYPDHQREDGGNFSRRSRSRSPPSVSSMVTVVSKTDQSDLGKDHTKPRCRDFDEKGFCMRGELCPFDHGVDPLVVDDLNIPNVLRIPGDRPPTAGPPLPARPPRSTPPPRPSLPLPEVNPLRPPLPPFGPPLPPPNLPPFRPPIQPTQLHDMQRRGLPPPNLSVPPPPPGVGPGPLLGPPIRFAPVPIRENALISETFEPGYNPEQPEMNISSGERFGENQRRETSRVAPSNLRNLVNIDVVAGIPNAENRESGVAQREATLGRSSPVNKGHSPQPSVPPVREVREASADSRRFVLGTEPKDSINSQESISPGDKNVAGKVPDLREKLSGGTAHQTHSRKFVPNNRTLEIRKIPRELNSIAKLNEHFDKFGTIVNLQVAYGGDPGAALLTFATHPQAKSAHSSSEAVLGNRFIKVFWHSPEDKPEQDQVPPKKQRSERIVIPSKDKLSIVRRPAVPEKPPVVKSASTGISKTVFNPAAMKRQDEHPLSPAQVSRKLAVAKEAVRKKNEETRKMAIQKQAEIKKQKQELLNMMIQKQKTLIAKLEAMKDGSATAKQEILKTIKSLAASIEKAKKELSPKQRTKAETQKELLDTELDLYNQQSEGQDTTELRKRVAALKQEARSLGLIGGKRGALRGRGRGRGRGAAVLQRRRRSSRSSTVLDKRPRQLRIAGFDSKEKEEVLVHLNEFGELENIDYRESTNDYVISYKTRQEAEMAVTRGTSFNGKQLSLSWHIQEEVPIQQAQDEPEEEEFPPDNDEDNVLEDEDEDDLLHDEDDDDDDDDESRAWRR